MIKAIHHIVLLWDESEHVSPKSSKELSSKFWRAYLYAFPEGKESFESPSIITTGSPMFASRKLTHFEHKGEFLPYEKKNKDLAIVKYASTGLVDQNNRYRFILDDLRYLRKKNGHPPILSYDACLVLFITSDKGNGMTEALRTTIDYSHELRTNFAAVQIEKGDERMERAGIIVGQELKSRFVKAMGGALLLDINTTHA
ncbi:MAG: hypothetical protein CVU51_06490 [Deltaproteobacteria bacterium HGW-Deltaproteobacteria-1]|jgi:hypothetical protein|nr:MAG: hypothetical protein CVU51_06490 [Deltaproteobacteria bacterium HGW-Deltaproteobacteria-1]